MTHRCWSRSELGHPGLSIILQHSRGGTSSKFRGSVVGRGIFLRRVPRIGREGISVTWVSYKSHLRVSSGWAYSILKSVLFRVIGLGIFSIFGSGGDRGWGGGAVNYNYIWFLWDGRIR